MHGCRTVYLACAIGAGVAFGSALMLKAQEKDAKKAETIEKVTLQYRIAKDAFAPTGFVAVIDGGTTLRLQLSWELPVPKNAEEKAAQEKMRKVFDELCGKLETKEINGVEFECRGEWVKKGISVRLKSVPQLTDSGKKRIKDNGG
jgi:hypothetical protein